MTRKNFLNVSLLIVDITIEHDHGEYLEAPLILPVKFTLPYPIFTEHEYR